MISRNSFPTGKMTLKMLLGNFSSKDLIIYWITYKARTNYPGTGVQRVDLAHTPITKPEILPITKKIGFSDRIILKNILNPSRSVLNRKSKNLQRLFKGPKMSMNTLCSSK